MARIMRRMWTGFMVLYVHVLAAPCKGREIWKQVVHALALHMAVARGPASSSARKIKPLLINFRCGRVRFLIGFSGMLGTNPP
tara:strand:- start:1910 stop:2158 length:249 start_codon:yes stop_codon:yes gene_type:complete